MQGVANPIIAQQKLAQGNRLWANGVVYHYITRSVNFDARLQVAKSTQISTIAYNKQAVLP